MRYRLNDVCRTSIHPRSIAGAFSPSLLTIHRKLERQVPGGMLEHPLVPYLDEARENARLGVEKRGAPAQRDRQPGACGASSVGRQSRHPRSRQRVIIPVQGTRWAKPATYLVSRVGQVDYLGWGARKARQRPQSDHFGKRMGRRGLGGTPAQVCEELRLSAWECERLNHRTRSADRQRKQLDTTFFLCKAVPSKRDTSNRNRGPIANLKLTTH